MEVSILKSLLDVEVLVDHDSLKNEVKMKEDSIGARLTEVIVGGLSSDALVFSFDRRKRISDYYSTVYKGVHAGCDYVVVTRLNEITYIVFVEMKSGTTKGFETQLLNSQILWEHTAALLKAHCFDDWAEVRKVFVLFSLGKSRKTRTDKQLPKSEKQGVYYVDAGAPTRIHIRKLIEAFTRIT